MKKIKTSFLATLKALMIKLESVRTADGKDLMVDGELEVGKDILIDIDGEYEPAPSGEYDTGEKVIVVEAGRITEIREKEPEPEPEPEDLRKQSFNALREHFSQTYEERVRKIVAAIIALGYSDYGYVVEASDEHAVWAYWDDATQEEKFVSFSLVWADEEVTASDPVEVVPTFKPKDAADPVDPADPAATAEMEMPSVQGRFRMSTSQSVSHTIIACPDGSPLLSATPCGLGRLYLFAMPLTSEWTDLVQQALFVPTLYNMALYSLPQPPAAFTLGNPDPILLRGYYDPTATPPQLTSSDTTFALLPDLRRAGSRSILVPHGDIRLAGHYRLGDEHLAFNYSRRESSLEFLAPSDVADRVASLEGYSTIRHAARPLDSELRARSSGTPLWRWCILAALLALAIEILLIKLPWRSSR